MTRKIHVIRGDIVFQWKYGFYFLYFIMIILYKMVLSMAEGEVKEMLCTIFVYSDPASLGLFFMGAVILLEKSQRVLNSIAVSPVRPGEYILGKILSFGVISEVVGLIFMTDGKTDNGLLTFVGILIASFLFSLTGIIVGTKIESINQYIVGTCPIEIVGFLPPIAYRLGLIRKSNWMLLHPGCAAMELMEGNQSLAGIAIMSMLLWTVLLYIIAEQCVKKMYGSVGGAKI